jgi:hypothetical protein
MKRKGLVCSFTLVLLLVFTSVRAEAQCYYNPLFLPFAVAGAVVRTVAAIPTVVVPALGRSPKLTQFRSNKLTH